MDEPFRLPVQDRSRKTLERLIEAGERLFAREAIAEVTVPRLVRAAKSSVGAFYARFAGKDEFLASFYEQYFEEARTRLGEQLADGAWVGKTAEEVVRGVMTLRADYYISRRNLLGKLLLHVRLTADERFIQPARAVNDEMFNRFQQLISTRRADLKTSPAIETVRHGLIIADAGLREFFLFGRGASAASLNPHQTFVNDAATMLWSLVSRSAKEKPCRS